MRIRGLTWLIAVAVGGLAFILPRLLNPHAAPLSDMNEYLANAEQQLSDGRLLPPANGNAWDSLDAARRINPTDPRMLMLSARLLDALGDASEQVLRKGDPANAREAFVRARELDARRGGDGSAIALLRKRLEAAFIARLDEIIAKPDPDGARQFLADADWIGLDPAYSRSVEAKLAHSPSSEPADGGGGAGATPHE
jgi:hypothetical protein